MLRVVSGLFTGIFGIAGLVWGLVSLIMAVLFMLPLFGWLNWILIPFASLGVIFGLGASVLTLCGIALALAFLRLSLGGGII